MMMDVFKCIIIIYQAIMSVRASREISMSNLGLKFLEEVGNSQALG